MSINMKYQAGVFNNCIYQYIVGCSLLTTLLGIHNTGTDLVFLTKRKKLAFSCSHLNWGEDAVKTEHRKTNIQSVIIPEISLLPLEHLKMWHFRFFSSYFRQCAPDIPEMSRCHFKCWDIHPKDLTDPDQDQARYALFKPCGMCVIWELTHF